MSKNSSNNSEMLDKLDWIQVRNNLHERYHVESFKEKVVRKTKENPLVPLGTIATISALTYGIWNFYKGNTKMSQYMMRARVSAQAFTLISMLLGLAVAVKKQEK
nr:HIG1 domain family member 2A, mitochondrial [Megalopta genalis]